MGRTGETERIGASSVRSVRSQAVRRFVWWSLAAFVICTVGGVLAVRAVAAEIAARDAGTRGASFARNVAAPLVNAAVRRGDAGPLTVLDTVMRNRMRDGSIVRIKIWSSEGKVIWSDDPVVNGETFTLEEQDAALLGTEGVNSAVSELDKPENSREQGFDELLEVYAGAKDADGRPLLVESYWSTDRILRDELVISTRVVPLIVGVLVVFMLAVLPLAFSLARRVDRAQADRAAMLRHALAASDRERRRISRELHDGLIQDLTSLGYALPAVARELPAGADAARELLESVHVGLRDDVTSLRSVLTELYPDDLASDGLTSAVEQLVGPLRSDGLTVDVHVADEVETLSPDAVQLVYRAVREGVRNVVKHATARRVGVEARLQDGDVVVTVTDDGVGPTDEAAAAAIDGGHLGIRMLQDDAGDIGGVVSLRALDTGGACLTVRFPTEFAWSWEVPSP